MALTIKRKVGCTFYIVLVYQAQLASNTVTLVYVEYTRGLSEG